MKRTTERYWTPCFRFLAFLIRLTAEQAATLSAAAEDRRLQDPYYIERNLFVKGNLARDRYKSAESSSTHK